MGQYKRIISYIYSYKHGDKGGNVGYARIEKMGDKCRITIQVRGVPVFKLPEVDLYRQRSRLSWYWKNVFSGRRVTI